jgi:hypothetical protein
MSCCADAVAPEAQGNHSKPSSTAPRDLQMRACLAWADTFLKCLAAPVAGRPEGDAGASRGPESVATGARESVLLHVMTSFAPGSHSRMALQPGTVAEEATEKLGSTGEPLRASKAAVEKSFSPSAIKRLVRAAAR